MNCIPSYKTPLLPPPREILNVGKIYKVAQFCTDLSKGDFRLSILDLFRPNMAGLEPKNNPKSKIQNPKSQIGTVNFLSRI
jgi:hypothetical protein